MSNSARPGDPELLRLLLQQVAAGTLAFKDIEPLLRDILPGAAPGGELPDLLARLDDTANEAGARLVGRL